MKSILSVIGATLICSLGVANQAWAQVAPVVPEIDATGALTGLAMLAGVISLVAEYKRRK